MNKIFNDIEPPPKQLLEEIEDFLDFLKSEQNMFLFITDIILAEYVRRRRMAFAQRCGLNFDVKLEF